MKIQIYTKESTAIKEYYTQLYSQKWDNLDKIGHTLKDTIYPRLWR